LPAGFKVAVVMQNTLVLPDRGAIVRVTHASGAEIDVFAYGDFYGLNAENHYLADSLIDLLGRRSSLKSVQRDSYGGPIGISGSAAEGSVGNSDPGIDPEPTEKAVVSSAYTHRGRKVYELKNHLGNVLAVVSDVKIGLSTSSQVAYYVADVVEMTDYEPFGMPLAMRHYVSGDGYRFGFQGQEGDDEWNGEGSMLAFKYRVHDVRLGRFLSVDPLSAKYPWNSSYAFSENRVIDSHELEGLESVQAIQSRQLDLNIANYDAGEVAGIREGQGKAALIGGLLMVDIYVTKGAIGTFLGLYSLGSIHEDVSRSERAYESGDYVTYDRLQKQAGEETTWLIGGVVLGGLYGKAMSWEPAIPSCQMESVPIQASVKYPSTLNRRVKLRKETRQAILSEAVTDYDESGILRWMDHEGNFILGDKVTLDPNTGLPVKGDINFGHKPEHQWVDYKWDETNWKKTRSEVNNEQNNSDIYRLEQDIQNSSAGGKRGNEIKENLKNGKR
jgi:RHS repeat-associated protein